MTSFRDDGADTPHYLVENRGFDSRYPQYLFRRVVAVPIRGEPSFALTSKCGPPNMAGDIVDNTVAQVHG